jgi:hypothetical protein
MKGAFAGHELLDKPEVTIAEAEQILASLGYPKKIVVSPSGDKGKEDKRESTMQLDSGRKDY